MITVTGVEQIREGVVADDALIVEQSPKHTIDILREGKVVTKAINKRIALAAQPGARAEFCWA